MKNLIPYAFLKITLLALIMIINSSCADSEKPEDTKDVAEEHNEAKFENTVLEKDAQFLVNAAELSLEQIQLGQLAQQNSNMIDVMRLGKMMETEHTKSLKVLNAIAQKKLITVPVSITDDAQEVYTYLSKKTGNKFDKTYCTKLIKEHKEAIALFEKASTELSDHEIREWAIATLPILRAHLDQAITCQKYCAKWISKFKYKQIGYAQIVN